MEDFLNYCESSSSSESDFSSDSSSESNSELETILVALEKRERNCINKYLEQIVPKYSEQEFVTHFRIGTNLYKQLVEKFSASDVYQQLDKKKVYSAETHIALFLWFAGHEACSFRDIGDRFNISIGTVSHMVTRVIYFISDLCDSTIKWPNAQRKNETSLFMKEKTGMTGVIGIIDGTRIRIDPPRRGRNDYIDRKNVISICMQGICDEKRKFIDIFVGHPGSVHDNRVYENSCVYQELPSICADNFLLGDSAYACSQYLITPYRDNGHLTSRQKFFNKKLSSGRIIIEHSFGILKQRFRQLYYCKLRGMKKICHFVRACVVLHNLCDENELQFEMQDDTESVENPSSPELNQGITLRERLCDEVYSFFN